MQWLDRPPCIAALPGADLPERDQCRSLETPLNNKNKIKGERVSRALTVLAATAIGIGVSTLPSSMQVATSEYADFFTLHERLHPPGTAKRDPIKVLVRKTFWNDHDRVLFVDARTTQGRGALMIVEGLQGSDWLADFRISADEGAVFDLIVPDGESVPCKVLVRSGAASTVTPVHNAPSTCQSADDPGKVLSRG